jgi:hypothetical protein
MQFNVCARQVLVYGPIIDVLPAATAGALPLGHALMWISTDGDYT